MRNAPSALMICGYVMMMRCATSGYTGCHTIDPVQFIINCRNYNVVNPEGLVSCL